MKRHLTTALAAILLCLAPAVSRADLSAYAQNFETLVQSNPGALSADGWWVFGNVFSPDHSTYYYPYGPYPAPNGGNGFCGIDVGQGGPSQGAQQLVVYNDYNNGDHGNHNLVEANVYQQQSIGGANIGSIWYFKFDAKLGNLVSPTTALAFIKTLDPNNGYAMTNFLVVDMTSIPATWGSHSIALSITPSLAGQLLQFGFASTTTDYAASGVFYDNISFNMDAPVPARSTTWGRVKALYR